MNRINLMILLMVLSTAGRAWGGGKMIQAGSAVKLDYTLTVDGQIVDATQGKGPLEYIHGQKMLIPGLEQELEGMKSGDEKKVSVKPEDAYGPVDPRGIVRASKEQLKGAKDVSAGQVLTLKGKDGQEIRGVVTQVEGDSFTIDFNHPLAGKALDFNVHIVNVEGP